MVSASTRQGPRARSHDLGRYLHTKATTRRGRAVYGGLTAASALGALLLGILLAG